MYRFGLDNQRKTTNDYSNSDIPLQMCAIAVYVYRYFYLSEAKSFITHLVQNLACVYVYCRVAQCCSVAQCLSIAGLWGLQCCSVAGFQGLQRPRDGAPPQHRSSTTLQDSIVCVAMLLQC